MRHGRLRGVLGVVVLAVMLAGGGTPAWAQITLPTGFSEQTIASGFTFPTATAFLPDGRMMVAEKRGKVWIVDNGVTRSTPFIEIDDEVNNTGDRGLLDIAIDPGFATNGYVYLLYTVDPVFGLPEETGSAFARLTRYTADPSTGQNTADLGSRTVLIGATPDQGFPICQSLTHTIGTLMFASDGTLFVGAGDGATPNGVDAGGHAADCFAPPLAFPIEEDIGAFRALDLDSPDGKILRIDPATGNGLPTNPYFTGDPTATRSKVWVSGLRNPFRFGIRPGSGSPETLFIGDVGWSTWEEIDVGYGGENFGWPCNEGFLTQPNYQAATPAHDGCNVWDGQPVTAPLLAWNHFTPSFLTPSGFNPGFIGSTSIGGVFYTGTNYPPQYRGYFFADFTGEWIRMLEVDAGNHLTAVRDFATDASFPVQLVAAPGSGDLVYVSIATGTIRRIRFATGTNFPPTANAGPDKSGAAGQVVTLDGSQSSDPNGDPITYHWSQTAGPTVTLSDPNVVKPTFTVPVVSQTTTATFALVVDDGQSSSAPDSVDVVLNSGIDLTALGTIIARVPNPIGGGNHNLEVIRDGDLPPAGTQDSGRQYDSYHGTDPATEDWIGYDYGTTQHTFTRVVFQEGMHFVDGGWFTTLGVQVRQGATWVGVSNLVVTPAYPGIDDGITYETYTLDFDAISGSAIRIDGTPGGYDAFISVGELTVIGGNVVGPNLPPTADAGADQGATGGQIVTLDGSGSFDPNGDTLHYHWSQTAGPSVTLSDATAPKPTFTAPSVGGPTVLTFSLVVDDGQLSSPADTVNVTDNGGIDLTLLGTIIARVPSPTGGGNHDLEVIRDGDEPPVGTQSSSRQYDSYDGANTAPEDWIGYDYGGLLHTFTRVVFQEGMHFVDGGWFTTLGVQVLQGGTWVDVTGLTSSPAYPGVNNGVTYETYTLDFDPTAGTAIRIDGAPGGFDAFISVGELQVIGTTGGGPNLPPTANAGPDKSATVAQVVTLDGSGSFDPNGDTLTYAWSQTAGPTVTLSGATTAHPGFTSPAVSGPTTLTFSLVVNDGQASSPPDTVDVVVNSGVDLSLLGTIIAAVPHPTGGGNHDLEVIRDGDKPPVGTQSSSRQYDSYDGANTAPEDWIGYDYGSLQHTFTRVVFQEGMHFIDGGWFTTLTVQVRQGTTWVPVSGLTITPAYPGINNGVTYETYTLDFDPIAGTAIRIDGAPGGFDAFISVGELEVIGDSPACGDGTVTPPEQCDDGNNLGNDGCSPGCRIEFCGDGTVNNVTEQCEPPGTATCDATCRLRAPVCGDGFVTPPETCEPPDTNLCSATCTARSPVCGDGFVTPPEQCDDGNHLTCDGCAPDCTIPPVSFACDVLPIFGELNGNCVRCHSAAGPAAGVLLDPSFPAATLAGLVNVPSSEKPAFMRAHPGLPADSYLIMKEMGDPRIDGERMPFFPPTYFDDHVDQLLLQETWIAQGATDDGCTAACVSAYCGDGVLNPAFEECDDGNTAANDGCGPTCRIERCGDGIVNGTEECDDGNTVDGDCCSAQCRRESCDDGNACTTDSCTPGTGCQHANVANGTACSDGNLCNGAETCQSGACTAGTALDCNDNDACTTDSCDPTLGCQHVAIPLCHGCVTDGNCANGDLCDGTERCVSGTCTAGTPLDCNDGNACTTDSCDPTTGCQHAAVANGTACSDGNVCNGAETCQAGTCTAGTALDCNDNNACTTDTCDPTTGCQHAAVANGTACSDGNVCNGAETCQAGTCTAGTALDCNDNNACTTDTCDPTTGCQHANVANGTACSDGNVCNGAETCQAGACTAGTALNCDDGNACTTDSCDPTTGCQHAAVANGTACSDGNVCNGAETCQAGTCTAGTALDCNDNNACTTDTCDPTTGCQHANVANGTACSDGNVCNGAETCQAGTCTAGTALDCNDNNACTTDSCNTTTGCQHANVANGTSCSDGNVCNGAETCQAGTCTAGTALNCDDGNACTIDSCNTTTGCQHTAGGCCTAFITQASTTTNAALVRNLSITQESRQRIKNASARTICRVDLQVFNPNGATGSFHVEIWSDAGGVPGVKLGGSSTDVDAATLPTAGPGALKTVTWTTKPQPTGDFWIVAVNSGNLTVNLKWAVSGGPNTYQDTGYDIWTSDVDRNRDAVFTIYGE